MSSLGMPYRVVMCEAATGIVCHPDGRRYLSRDGPRSDPEFTTEAEAAAYAQEVVAGRPDLECWVVDPAGRTLHRVPPVAE
ncbi:MAG: hypothetical protein K2X82_04510 [Gemmataceae bacterium]|nr:hypothetical protein [Gemmataceae bacterium]